jgi:hypothetical protein
MAIERTTQVTVPDSEAAHVQASAREDALTFELLIPRRKRYDERLQRDLRAQAPPIAERNAPRAVLDL